MSTSTGTSTIAPGAEQVGQAQILTTFSKPFELNGLFSAADAGAFDSGGSEGGGEDIPMDGREEGEVAMDEDQ